MEQIGALNANFYTQKQIASMVTSLLVSCQNFSIA